MKTYPVLALSAVALILAACSGETDKTGDQASVPEVSEAATDTEQADAPAPTPASVVDLNQVAISTADLGAFPFVALPNGYLLRDSVTMDLAAFPIWTGQGFQTVEGKVYMARSGTPDGKTYSRLEFQRAIDASIKALGGVQVANSQAPNPAIDDLPETLRSDMSLGLGSLYGNPIITYVIRQPGRTVWIHLLTDSSQANWAIVEAPAVPAA